MFWFVLFVLVLAGRTFAILPRPSQRRSYRKKGDTCSLAVFLGSGGHTSEALALISSLDFGRYTPRIYLVSEGDHLSVQKAAELEKLKGDKAETYRILSLPRARRVHQTFLSTPPTFLKSLFYSFNEVFLIPAIRGHSFADVLLLNGPGTCVPVCVAIYASRFFGLASPRLIYVESFARVKSLSLSGKILRPFVDRFIVQWPQLLQDGRRGDNRGWLV